VDLKRYIRDVPDFPKPGILFRDLTPLLRDPAAMKAVADRLTEAYAAERPTVVVGIESRGFLFGIVLALRLGVGFVPIRKAGKLPAARLAERYALEYGEGVLEMHEDALTRGDRVVVVDDLLATGGTAAAAARLVERQGGNLLGFAFVVELSFLDGRSRLPGHRVVSLVRYE
jgi:adenine phosphoribosyltransferase